MKLYHILALALLASPAFAQTYTAQPYQPYQEPSRVLGSLDGAPRWTAADVQALCETRWPGQLNSIRDCTTRNQSKIGRNMTPADQQEVNLNKKPAPMPMQAPAQPVTQRPMQPPVKNAP